ncbi:phospholipid-transporting ATPase ABCA3 [Rhipicephalus microplus]|uniref:phospholipid-transporting ATPase ABCA3 n=1 Tax=Rhipicephalus microplus TaxID=6941 RepID=UPI003F6A6121
MGSSIRQLYIILWKDVYINQIRRHVVWTLLELAFTVIAMYGIGKDSLQQRFGDPVPEEAFARVQPLHLWEYTATKILYTPDVELLAKVIRKVCEDLSIESTEAVATPAELDDRVERGFDHYGSVVGVAFEEDLSNVHNLPDQIRYRVRMQGRGFDMHLRYWKDLETPGPLNVYSTSEMNALLPLQYSLEHHMLHQISVALFGEATAAPPQLQLQRFPYPAFYPEGFNSTYSRIVFHFGVGFLLPFASVVAKITDEKCSGMRELLSIAGTSDLIYWGSHFLSASFTTLLLSCICMLFLFVLGTEPALSYSDPLLVFVVLITFNSLSILHAMFVSVLLTSSELSNQLIIHQLHELVQPYKCLRSNRVPIDNSLTNPLGRGYYLRSRASKIITSTSPGMGLHWAFMVIERFERFRGGVNWSNMNDSASTLDNVSLSDLLMVNVCTCFLMIFLIWYMDNIIPWGPGIHKPPWFPFLKSYWMPQPAKNVKSRPNPDPTLFEADPQHLIPAIQVISLKKLYRNFLLQHINLKIFRHQITVLLGPCGSGKTTVIKMVTGLVHPSSGQIIVDNYDVVLHTDEARERIAYCPADNVLFNELTVEEHLLFFGMLKGLRMSKIRPEINLLLTDIQMSPYMSYRPSTLSDGMKRLLCVAIALLVASKCKIMIFDEPTDTMDPHSQREVWELLLKARRHCCILLTTQNVHEADALADKIGIMNKGLLWCSGSPRFLRERFRAGYNIRILKEPGCDATVIEALFKRYIPNAVVKLDTNFEVQYAIGVNPGSRRLTAMFKELDRDREILKIGAMSVAMSSLEEVLDKGTNDPTIQTGVDAGTTALTDCTSVYKPRQAPGKKRFLRQLSGLLKKRFYVWLRDWHPPVVRCVVPVCMLLLATYLQHLFTEDKIVSSDFYKDRFFYSVRTLHVPAVGFVTANGSTDPVVRHLINIFAEEDVRLTDISEDHTNSRLLDYAYDKPRAYTYLLLFGAVLDEDSPVTLWFNGQCPHAAPLIVNMYHSALLRNITGRPTARFFLYNQPYNNDTLVDNHSNNDNGDSEEDNLQVLVQSKLFFAGLPLSADALLIEVLMGIFTPLALCFHVASFVVYPITERCSKFKHLQMMTGVSGTVYWLSNFIFDTLLATSCAVIFVPTIVYSHRYAQKAEYIVMLVLLFVAHALSMVPFCYLASTLFSDSSFALSIMVIFFFFIGLLGALETVIAHFAQTVAEARLLSLLPQALDILLRIVPTFTLTRGISQLQRLQRENEICLASDEMLAIACKNVMLGRTMSLKYCCSVLTSRNVNDTMDEVHKVMAEPYELSGAVMIEVFVMLAEAVMLLAFVVIMDSTAYARVHRKLRAKVYAGHLQLPVGSSYLRMCFYKGPLKHTDFKGETVVIFIAFSTLPLSAIS